MCLLSVSSFVWFLSIFIPENLPPTRFSFLPVHLPPPPPPLPPPSSSTSASHQSLSFPSLRSPRPPSHELSTYTRRCVRVLARMLMCWCACVCVCGCGCKCVRVSESHRCCIAGLSPQGPLSHREEKEQSFPKLMSVCVHVCVYVTCMDVLWTWIWSEMPQWGRQPKQFSGALSWNGPRDTADIDPHQWHNPKPLQTLQLHADNLPNGPRRAGFLQYLSVWSKNEENVSLRAGKKRKVPLGWEGL